MAYLEIEYLKEAYLRLQEVIEQNTDLKTRLLHLRQLLEFIYKKLCESEKTSFPGLFARMQFIHNQHNFPEELVMQVNQLRILCNKVAHEDDFAFSQTHYLHGLWAMAALLHHLDPEHESVFIKEYLQQNQATPFPAFTPAEKQSFLCVVTSFNLLSSNGKTTGLELNILDEEGCACQVTLNDGDGEGRAWSRLSKVLWRYCTLQFHTLSCITGKSHCYMNNPQTTVVVEPDFLIDASSLAECFTPKESRPEFFILNKLIKEASSEKPLQGVMVNNILDELILEPDSDYQTLFSRGMARQPISFAALGKEATLRIYHTIKDTHFKRLQDFAASLQDDLVQLEPSFLSFRYGLQGRLDVLFQRNGKYHIVELKSGSAPGFDVWKPHQMQVVAYNMLIRDCYTSAKLGNSSIFYSSVEENGLRHVVNASQLELDLMMCRNRVVGILHGLAADPSSFFKWLLQATFSQETGFIQEQLIHIIGTLKALTDYEMEWFLEQVRLLANEIWMEKTGGLGRDSIHGHNSLWRDSRQDKKDRYRLLDELKITSVNNNLVEFALNLAEDVTDFRPGDIVILYRQTKRIDQQEILRGQILEIDTKHATIRIRGGLRTLPAVYQTETWAMEHDILETSLYSPLNSLFGFLTADREMREVILGIKEQSYVSEVTDGSATKDIIKRINNSNLFHIIQGPPGTGKTSGLLTTYIKDLYNDTDRLVLLLSFTNRAVDEICLNLKKHALPFIRTGQSEAISEDLLENLVLGKRFDEVTAVLKNCRILVATVQSCNSWIKDLLKLIKFDELIIDEASQILENGILGIISNFSKVILIGDQNQLPPISRMDKQGFEFTHPQLQKLGYSSYSQSLMERLCKVCESNGWQRSFSMLSKHYRMHEQLAELVQGYYHNRLDAGGDRQKAGLTALSHPLLSSRLVWVDCPPSSTAYFDQLQVRCIAKIIELYLQYGVASDLVTDLGIVAPFRAMIHELRKSLPDTYQSITIDTVERFQGSERKNIIITLPLHNGNSVSRIEALNQDGSVDRKLNVALSRAQDRVVILGNVELCSRSPHYKLLVDKIQASGKMLTYKDIIQE